jgi:hypothetical protein
MRVKAISKLFQTYSKPISKPFQTYFIALALSETLSK